MTRAKSEYIPALYQHWLTPLYDPFMRYLMREKEFKRRLIRNANPQPGEKILDLGSGTGTLTIMLQKAQPAAVISGMDIDPTVLNIALQKAIQENLPAIQWDRGQASDLPYQDKTFDLVVSSLMIHHLAPDEKKLAFEEVFRVLKPGGRFQIADFGPPHDPVMRLITIWMAMLEQTADNFQGQIPIYLKKIGFEMVTETGFFRTVFGPISFYQSIRPQDE